jgi:hypothetical protein
MMLLPPPGNMHWLTAETAKEHRAKQPSPLRFGQWRQGMPHHVRCSFHWMAAACARCRLRRRLCASYWRPPGRRGTARAYPTHFDRAIAFYDPGAHRRLATRFGQDLRVAILSYRSFALWMLGYPEAALADTEHALKEWQQPAPSPACAATRRHWRVSRQPPLS